MPQTNKKLIVATLETSAKTDSGKKRFKMTATAMAPVEIIMARAGTCRRDSLAVQRADLLLPVNVSEKSNLPVLKIDELQADAAAVNTTKLIMSAAAGIPTLRKTSTKGLLTRDTSRHG